jgi:hypothetical protein
MATCTFGKRKSKYAIHCNVCHQEMLVAAQSERVGLNLAVQGAIQKPVIETAFGPYEVLGVTRERDCHCRRAGSAGSADRTFCGCNDGTWAQLMAQVAVARHARWGRQGALDEQEPGRGDSLRAGLGDRSSGEGSIGGTASA